MVQAQKNIAQAKKVSTVSRGGFVPIAKSNKSINMSSDERYWLEKLIEAETADEPYEGKVAVATTIANRVTAKEFPNTVMGVIKAGNKKFHQYSPWDDGSIYKRNPSPETKRAVAEVFDNGVRNLPEDAVYFYAPKYSANNWIAKTRKQITKIGGHVFCSKHEK